MNFITRMRERHARNTAIREALDNLPSPICYFTPDGSIKLCNIAMYDIYRKIAGSDLQCQEELAEALGNCGRTNGILRDGNVFIFPDGSAWQYSEREIRLEDGRCYTEAVFINVTELYEKRRELEEQSRQMKEMYAELMTLSEHLQEITRDQEILYMKQRLHDQMNLGITAIRQSLRRNTTLEENAFAVEQFRRAIQILQEYSAAPEEDALSEFLRDAEVSGVRVIIDGVLPEDEGTRSLAVAVMREACVNAARHGDACTLNVVSEVAGDRLTMNITNDGHPPEREIVPRGGLRDLAGRIGKAGGSMRVRSLPVVELTVTLPVGRPEAGRGEQE